MSARIERNGSHAQYVNQIGSLLGDQTIKHILKKESDVDSIPVKCSTVHDIVEGSHLDIEDVDVLYVDVEASSNEYFCAMTNHSDFISPQLPTFMLASRVLNFGC